MKIVEKAMKLPFVLLVVVLVLFVTLPKAAVSTLQFLLQVTATVPKVLQLITALVPLVFAPNVQLVSFFHTPLLKLIT